MGDLNRQSRAVLSDLPLFIVACKCDSDSVSSRAISQELAQGLALEYGAAYFETSALRNEGLEELFDAVIK